MLTSAASSTYQEKKNLLGADELRIRPRLLLIFFPNTFMEHSSQFPIPQHNKILHKIGTPNHHHHTHHDNRRQQTLEHYVPKPTQIQTTSRTLLCSLQIRCLG